MEMLNWRIEEERDCVFIFLLDFMNLHGKTSPYGRQTSPRSSAWTVVGSQATKIY